MFIPLHDQNPLRIIPFQVVTLGLIALCTLIFLYQRFLPELQQQQLLLSYGMLPGVLFDQFVLAPELVALPAELTLLSALFLHSGWLHLIGNMAFLWVFGDNIEDCMGHWRFLLFFCLCGVLANLTHAFAEAHSINPLVGASGGVSGILAAYLMLHPRVKIIVLLMGRLPLRLPAHLLLLGWIGLQVFNVVTGAGGSTAWWAHIGGFAAGAALIPFFKHASVPYFDRGTRH